MFGLSQKIQLNGKWFPLTVNHAPKPCKIFYTCILPSIDFHPRKIEEREKQQELRLHIQAPARASIAHPSISKIVAPQHRLDCHHPRPIHPKLISFSTQSSSAPSFLFYKVHMYKMSIWIIRIHNPIWMSFESNFFFFFKKMSQD